MLACPAWLSWPPSGVSSCSGALQARTLSWSLNPRRRQRWCRPWRWCRGCCLRRGRWSAAGHLTLPSPVHGLKGNKGACYHLWGPEQPRLRLRSSLLFLRVCLLAPKAQGGSEVIPFWWLFHLHTSVSPFSFPDGLGGPADMASHSHTTLKRRLVMRHRPAMDPAQRPEQEFPVGLSNAMPEKQ